MKSFIRFEEIDRKPKTKVYGIFSLKDNSMIAKIYWYAQWRQYIFDPLRNTIWNQKCLTEITLFLKQLMENHKK